MLAWTVYRVRDLRGCGGRTGECKGEKQIPFGNDRKKGKSNSKSLDAKFAKGAKFRKVKQKLRVRMFVRTLGVGDGDGWRLGGAEFWVQRGA